MTDVSKLPLAKQTGFNGIGDGVLLATYDPEEEGGSLTLHFRHSPDSDGVEAYEIRRVIDNNTGAVWYTLDGVHHTVATLATVGRFTLPLKDYLSSGPNYREWIPGQTNINHLEAWIFARGDAASAQKLRETFPKIFAPATAPQTPPEPQLQSRSRWRWPF